MSKWQIQGSRVYGNGQSYNCTNKVTAEQLNNTLNNYEKISQQFKQTEQKLDKAQKGIINLQITLKIMEHEINKLKEEIQ